LEVKLKTDNIEGPSARNSVSIRNQLRVKSSNLSTSLNKKVSSAGAQSDQDTDRGGDVCSEEVLCDVPASIFHVPSLFLHVLDAFQSSD
jgi:hypothetical protein